MSEFNYATVFINNDDNVHHIVLTESLPSILSLKGYFDELLNDEEFGTHDEDFVNSLRVEVVTMKSLLKQIPNFYEMYPEFAPKSDQEDILS